jgi:hypothetical protein
MSELVLRLDCLRQQIAIEEVVMKPAAGTEKELTSLDGDQDDKQDNLEPVLPFDRELDIMNVPARGCRAESNSHVNEGGCCIPVHITKHLWMGLCFLGAHAACYKNFLYKYCCEWRY